MYDDSDEIDYIKGQVLQKFPLLGVTMSALNTVADSNIGTAATDGHNIYYSPKFFSSLSDDEKTFIYAVSPYSDTNTDPKAIIVDVSQQKDVLYSGSFVPSIIEAINPFGISLTLTLDDKLYVEIASKSVSDLLIPKSFPPLLLKSIKFVKPKI